MIPVAGIGYDACDIGKQDGRKTWERRQVDSCVAKVGVRERFDSAREMAEMGADENGRE